MVKKKEPEGQCINIFWKEFEKESDRASIIVAATMLDSSLENIIKKLLVPASSADDSFLEGANAPISSFSARIDLAYRLGLISAAFCRDLHIIRKIRNDCAHEIMSSSFENQAIKSRVTELVRSSSFYAESVAKNIISPKKPRGQFEVTVSWMLFHLSKLSEAVQTTKQAAPEWAYQEPQRVKRRATKSTSGK